MIATSKDAYIKTNGKQSRVRHKLYTSEDIQRIVNFGDSVEQAELSQHFYKTSGLYKRIITHYATFLTYSWLLVPHLKNVKDKITDRKLSQIYYNATDFCSTFQIERKCNQFARDVLVKGAYYGLICDYKDDVAIVDLPFEYCRSRFKNRQELDIVEFNLKFFDNISDEDLRIEILKSYPKEIQKGYYRYKHKGDNSWMFIPAEMGIYFNFYEEIPFFLDLIPLLDDLEERKDIDKKRQLQGLKRILVQKVGVDGMRLVFEPDEAEEMHMGVLEMLQNNPDVDVITTYNDIDLLDLSGDEDDATKINEIQELIYESAGVSKELFGATTDAGLKFSLRNDLSMMMVLGYKFAHFFSAIINNKFSNKKIKFRFIMLPVSYYNNDEYTARAKDLAAFGYSFLTPVASSGINQTNLTDLKELENELLNLDEALKPLQSSYTQSGKTNAITAAAAKNAEEEASKELENTTSKSEDDNEGTSSNEEETDAEVDNNQDGGGEK